MKRTWNDKNISKALQKLSAADRDENPFDRAWFKIEDRLAAPKRDPRNRLVWRPWAHPVRWVALAACLCVTFTGIQYRQVEAEKNEVASYLITISDPMGAINRDQDFVKVSTLLSEPSTAMTGIPSSNDDHSDAPSGDEIFL
jgi:hypothetical protein